MQLKRTLPLLTMAVLLFCSFMPAPVVKHFRIPTSVDFIFYNNTAYDLDEATFSSTVQQLVYNKIPAGTTTPGAVIGIETSGDSFTYTLIFNAPPKTASVINVRFNTRTISEVIPAGVAAYTSVFAMPLPTSGIVVRLDPK